MALKIPIIIHQLFQGLIIGSGFCLILLGVKQIVFDKPDWFYYPIPAVPLLIVGIFYFIRYK
jgi:hypothetical protein